MAVTRRCSVEKVFLKISQNSPVLRPETFIQEDILAQVFSCEFCKIFKNTFFYKTLLVIASDKSGLLLSLQLIVQA